MKTDTICRPLAEDEEGENSSNEGIYKPTTVKFNFKTNEEEKKECEAVEIPKFNDAQSLTSNEDSESNF